MCLKKFVTGLKVIDNLSKPLKPYCDNESSVYVTYVKSSVAVKRIDTKYYVVKEKV